MNAFPLRTKENSYFSLVANKQKNENENENGQEKDAEHEHE